MNSLELNTAVIGLGANLGDPTRAFAVAITSLRELGEVRAISALYRTEAVGPPQPDYHNAAVLLRTELAPRRLLDELLRIEAACGRERRERWGPRLLDLDLLWLEGKSVSEPGLQVPHPRLTQRAFALRPLLDVVPDAEEPFSGRPYTNCLACLEQQVECLAPAGSGWERRG